MTIEDVFVEGGILNQRNPSYEYRQQQLKMAKMVDKSFNENQHAIIEGATGVGKSFAYLVPIIINDKKVIVSTSNKSLQDQLSTKDLPFLKETIAPELTWETLKGKGNYFCHKNFVFNRLELGSILKQDEINKIKEWADTTETGELSEIPFKLDQRVYDLICCDEHTNHKKGTHYYNSCFAMKARERVKKVDIILVNHTLLALDQYMRYISKEFEKPISILPDVKHIVIDEAHQFENMAVKAFTEKLNIFSMYHFVNNLTVSETVETALLENLLEEFRTALNRYAPPKQGYYYSQTKIQSGITGFEMVKEHLKKAMDQMSRNPSYQQEEGKELIDKAISEAKNLIRRIGEFEEPTQYDLYWAEAYGPRKAYKGRKEPIVSLNSAPITIAPILKDSLLANYKIVATSATLAVDGSFEFFRYNIGLQEENVLELIVDSPFDYKENTLLYFSTGEYDMVWELEELLKASKGRAFVLFTSYKDMEFFHGQVNIPYPKFIQDGTMNRTQILNDFRETSNAVLFATKSFWEGVDVKGDELSMVVIHKIPFGNPSELLYSSKVEMLDRKHGKGSGWSMFSVPEACLQLKQGAGRLIRSKTDKGVIALLDARVGYKNYGKKVVSAFPPSAPRTRQLDKVKAFFDRLG